jgi:hypothetical protein
MRHRDAPGRTAVLESDWPDTKITPMNPAVLRRRPFLRLTGLATLGAAAGLHANDRPAEIHVEGYAGQVSYPQGAQLELHISSSLPRFAVEIARLGATREVVWSGTGDNGRIHPIPEDASSNGCRWPVGLQVPIGAAWRPGYYHVTLRVEDRGGKYTRRNRRSSESSCYFIVRSNQPGRDSKILLQLSTHTYNAYNNWGGFSLYAYNGQGGNQGHRVSYLRPPESQFSSWEQAFVQWAESSGYTLDYAANGDLESHPEILAAYKLVLSVGHDEYWSGPMRDHLEKFITNGGNVAFFSGNTCCWQVRAEDNGTALTCWKQNVQQDPVFVARKSQATLATLWSHHLVQRPENQLTGVGFLWGGYHKSHGQLMDASGAFNVHRPDHWIFEGTQLKAGDAFGAKDTIVGYECDGCELTWKDGLPTPTYRDGTPPSFQILASAPAQWHPDDCEWYERWEPGRKGNAVLGVYTRGGTVFTCGSTDWSHGLRGRDPIVERITRNILDRLGK